MPQYNVPLGEPIPSAYSDELHRRIFFLAEEIEEFTFDQSGDRIIGVTIHSSTAMDPEDLAERVDRVVRTEVLQQRPAEQTVIWRSPHPAQVADNAFERLMDQGVVLEAGEGQYVLGPQFVAAMSYIDALLSDIALCQFSALEYQYPTLISTDVISRTGYASSFPQLLMSVSRLHADSHSYRQFLAEVDAGRHLAETIEVHSRHSGYMLPPTMCYHVYHQLRGQRLGSSTSAIYTARGKSFRYESRYRKGLERLWDFTIREVVFVGSRDWVSDQRRAFLNATLEVVDGLGLGGQVEVANDPFFGDARSAEQVTSQRMLHLKYELRLPVSGGRTVAAGSFNVHGTTFSEPFGIDLADGQPAHTACVGFGLERFTYAFICRYGTDQSMWPGFRSVR